MRLPAFIRRWLKRAAYRVVFSREPDFELPNYMMRWHLVRSRWGCLYVHLITGNDDDRALHDHRSWNISVLLAGAYLEHLAPPKWRRLVSAGDIVARRATTPHRLEVLDGMPVLTLFITGPHQREWGFWAPNGWMQCDEFLQGQGK